MKNTFIGAAVLVLAPLTLTPAHAHIVFEQNAGPAGSYQKLTLRVGHGCAGSATNSVTVALPEGISGAKPQPKSGWNIASASAREVSWKGGPLPDSAFDEFSMLIKLPDTAGTYIFKVAQVCENGRMDWAELPGVTGKYPAPVYEVLPAAANRPHH